MRGSSEERSYPFRLRLAEATLKNIKGHDPSTIPLGSRYLCKKKRWFITKYRTGCEDCWLRFRFFCVQGMRENR